MGKKLAFIKKGMMTAAFMSSAFRPGRAAEFHRRHDAADKTSKELPITAASVFDGDVPRIVAGFELCRQNRIKHLLISGASPKITLKEMLEKTGYTDIAANKDCKIVWGQKADNTAANAVETREWLEENDIKQFYLITSSFHMPRSMENMERHLPKNVEFVPYTVALAPRTEQHVADIYKREMKKYMAMPLYNPLRFRP